MRNSYHNSAPDFAALIPGYLLRGGRRIHRDGADRGERSSQDFVRQR